MTSLSTGLLSAIAERSIRRLCRPLTAVPGGAERVKLGTWELPASLTSEPSADDDDQRNRRHGDGNRCQEDQKMREGNIEHAAKIPRFLPSRPGAGLAAWTLTVLVYCQERS